MIALTLPPAATTSSGVAKTVKTTYRHRVLYGNSTGSLVAVMYLHCGSLSKFIDGLAVNGPFFDWNLAAYAEVLMSSATLTNIYAKIVEGGGRYVEKGSGVSPYSIRTWAQYYYDVRPESGRLRSVESLNTTSEWAKAVTAAQKALKSAAPVRIPIFAIASMADTWVRAEQVLQTVDVVGPRRTEILVANAEHDVFLSTTLEKVRECQGYLLQWLRTWFPS